MPIKFDELDEELFSLDEISQKLDVTTKTLRERYIQTGELKARKIGVKWFVTKTNLKQFLNMDKSGS